MCVNGEDPIFRQVEVLRQIRWRPAERGHAEKVVTGDNFAQTPTSYPTQQHLHQPHTQKPIVGSGTTTPQNHPTKPPSPPIAPHNRLIYDCRIKNRVKNHMKKYTLEITVFTTGAMIMVMELAGSRILAPYLGTSIFVWTSIIGIILGSLSIGYWLGGKIADENANYQALSIILLASALLVASTAILKEPILQFIETSIPGIRLGSVIATTVLFAPASIFMGMVSPYTVRLKIHSVEQSGRTVGNLYAISTIGSIFGTFAAGFFLISFLGNTKLLIVIALTTGLISILVHRASFLKIRSALILALLGYFISFSFAEESLAKENGISIDTNYNHIQIYETIRNGQPARILSMDKTFSSAMYLNSDDLVFRYTKFYRLAEHFHPTLKNGLLIGGGAYSYPKDFLKNFPKATMDVVEIDPQLTEISKQYFNLKDDPRLQSFHEDGRTFLNKNTKQYDAIFIDAFKSYSIPYQLATIEAAQKIYNSLSDDGIVLMNIISSIEGDTGKFLRAEYATYKKLFSQVYVFGVSYPNDGNAIQNLILVALKSSTPAKFANNKAELQEYLDQIWTKEIPLDIPILTDDFAPVDQYIMKLLNE